MKVLTSHIDFFLETLPISHPTIERAMSNSFHTRSTSCSLVNLAGMVGEKCWYGKSISHFSRIKQLQGRPAFCMHYVYTTQEQGELSREHGKAFTSHGLKKVLLEAQASFWKKKNGTGRFWKEKELRGDSQDHRWPPCMDCGHRCESAHWGWGRLVMSPADSMGTETKDTKGIMARAVETQKDAEGWVNQSSKCVPSPMSVL